MDVVAIVTGEDKRVALERVMEKTHFFSHLSKVVTERNKRRSEALVAIKPNIMVIYSKDHLHVGTDPELVEYLAKRISEEGYTTAVVESRNIYTQWFPKRTVKLVAKTVGYRGQGYTLVDLTEEPEPYDYQGELKNDFVGTTWKNADYRISFCKNKTHLACLYTLSLKNVFGTLPVQDKWSHYHETIGWDRATLDVLRNFPPDFAFIDAFWSSDGLNGGVFEHLNHTKTLIGGTSAVAVDWVGALKMGVNPLDNPLMKAAVTTLGRPEYTVDGDMTPYEKWTNISSTIARALLLLENLKISTSLYRLMLSRLIDPEFD
ncbi:MAG: DUF362 domain-containing protein [Theionarchaea archaeon]|nr:DUF362 domain-containing protein [Theionarchaea archaeon]MBU7019620.1 DUF362 domain-containing protein [Theionarchaea archaeon]MBU7033798.1 DUF362 domain-containing protein [Theionarchaea archaeon]